MRRDLVLVGVTLIVVGLFLAFALPPLVASTNPITRSYSVVVPPLASWGIDFRLSRGDTVELSMVVRGGSNDIDLAVLDPWGRAVLRTRVYDSFTTSFTAGEDGVYALRLNNTFSILTSKSVGLTIEIKPHGTAQQVVANYVYPIAFTLAGIGIAMTVMGMVLRPKQKVQA